MNKVMDVKNAGNHFFSKARYKAAIRKYKKCLRYIDYAKVRIDKFDKDKERDDCKYTRSNNTLTYVVPVHKTSYNI